jgi:multiple antibiotic resistance protein
MELNRFIGLAMLLYSLSNPVGVIPIFLGLTKNRQMHRVQIVAAAALAVACLLCVSAIIGERMLRFFDVGLDDFRIAGGLLALFIAFEMFQAHYGGFMQTVEEKAEAESHVHELAITPLAFPLLVGPAEMSIMITNAADSTSWADKAALVGAGCLTAALIAVTLLAAGFINGLIGKTGLYIATRVMALFVAAVGIHFIFTGIQSELPGLLH